ncbi:MAG: type I-E CRISPR-associated protein Cse2/CasB [Ruminiclostridium sp.]|nr:type I-E CRISPR-associated protein Cse2/CasB [Ruminiclostridium sp.]
MNNDVYTVVKRQIVQIVNSNSPLGRATLAKLRRGAGKSPGSIPDIWGITVGALPENAGNFAEQAVHVALTLFAVHRQGTEISGQNGGTLGAAVSKLKSGDNDEALTRRFNSTVTAATITELSVHLRSLVQLLRAKQVDMDYPRLAKELYDWQFDSENTRLRWGRDYWRLKNIINQEEESDDEQ